MSGMPLRRDFVDVVSAAVKCRACFADITYKNKKGELELIPSALIDIAQPRWVGNNYWDSKSRIVILMLNPGSGAGRKDAKDKNSPDRRSLSLIQAFASGARPLSDVFIHQENDMPNWGVGRFFSFYLEGLNLELSDIAFVNIAWCATINNSYPNAMLNRCFDRHTSALLRVLAPNIVLLSGSGTHRFAHRLRSIVSGVQTIPMFHYAHREGAEAEAAELARVKQLIGSKCSNGNILP